MDFALPRLRALMSLPLALGALGCAPAAAPETTSTAGEEAPADEGFASWDSEASEEAAPRASAIETLGLTPPETPWADMNAHDREWYMVGKVLPIMAEVFRGHDGERFAELSCESCHGENMREVNFAMPSPRMYRIAREGTPAFAAMERNFGPMVEFMRAEVTPKMTAIMGVEMTCGSCHPTDAAR
jgi:hypothetical protein